MAPAPGPFVMVVWLGVSSLIAQANGLHTDLPSPATIIEALTVGFPLLQTWLLIDCALGSSSAAPA